MSCNSSRRTHPAWLLCLAPPHRATTDDPARVEIACATGQLANLSAHAHRGSKFLKAWMTFLEEHADLRYPDLADAQEDER